VQQKLSASSGAKPSPDPMFRGSDPELLWGTASRPQHILPMQKHTNWNIYTFELLLAQVQWAKPHTIDNFKGEAVAHLV